MDAEARRRLRDFRRSAGPIENQVIDDVLGQELDRRSFIRRGALFGLSLPIVSYSLGAAGLAPLGSSRATDSLRFRAAGASATLRLGIDGQPYGPVEPYTFNSTSDVDLAAPAGEYLTRANSKGLVVPELAVVWTPNATGSRWTVKLRPNVKFQNGQPMTASDVIATYKVLTDPAKGSVALSTFKGVLSPEGISQGPDELTILFDLETALPSFPYAMSSVTFQSIILPASYKDGTFTSTPQGTGPYQFASYTTSEGATYTPYQGWWGGQPSLAGINSTIYSTTTALDAALLSGSADLADYAGDRTIYGAAERLQIFTIASGGMQQVAMRVDQAPWNDYRVRQALAYAVDREAILKAVNFGYGAVGNDYPFAPLYEYTVSMPQRQQDLRKAKELLAAAGHPDGLSATLITGNEPTKAGIAQVVQASAKAAGFDISLSLPTPTVYYGGSATTTPWLNAPFTVTTWANRPLVNPYLTATLMSGGSENASRYANPKFDALAKSFLAAVSVADQRKYAQHMEAMLLHDTPYLVVGWPEQTTAGSKKVRGFSVEPFGMSLGHVSIES